MVTTVTITTRAALTDKDLSILRRYLSNAHALSASEWRSVRNAIDQLAQWGINFGGRHYTFKQFYATFINGTYARPFLSQLPALVDLEKEGTALQAVLARKILLWLKANGIAASTVYNAELLIIYSLYWWAAFAKGYLFEQIVIRDLQASSIQCKAHVAAVGQERYTRYDLFITDLGSGDIKASLYFLDDLRDPTADFYVTQLYDAQQRQLYRVVFLYPEKWQILNGTPIAATVLNAPKLFPKPVLVTILNKSWVMVQYERWKESVLQWQRQGTTNG